MIAPPSAVGRELVKERGLAPTNYQKTPAIGSQVRCLSPFFHKLRENETWTPGRIAWQWPAPSCPLQTAGPAEHFDQWPPVRPRAAVAAPTSTRPSGPQLIR